MTAMPAMAPSAASQVRSGIGSLSTMRAHTTVSSGAMLIITSAFAVVVSESAMTNAVNITAHIAAREQAGNARGTHSALGGFFR